MKLTWAATGPTLMCVTALLLTALPVQAQRYVLRTVKVVDMIPETASNEVYQDSEPNLAVNPSTPWLMAASAFTPDPGGSSNSPIFVSRDGGATWTLNVVLPGKSYLGITADVTLRFATDSTILYASIIRGDNMHLNILRTHNFLENSLMEVLVDRGSVDQPYLQAATTSGTDRVFVGNNNNVPVGPQTATLDVSGDAAAAPPPAGFSPILLETRTAARTPYGSQDGPSIRSAIHSDGTIYAAFFGWRTFSFNNTSDIVVVRDDNWGTRRFVDLKDPGDNKAGIRVVTGATIPGLSNFLGTERIGSQLAIAVDPTRSSTVYLAWGDGVGHFSQDADYTVHLRRSTDRGDTWSGDLRSVNQATNPALAINSVGEVGFLYQKLIGTGNDQRWETHLETTKDGFASAPTDWMLANVADDRFEQFSPSIGDYIHVMAVGQDFYGVFSGDNLPVVTNFPLGVTYQRYADFNSQMLFADSAHTIALKCDRLNCDSVDPYFFRLSYETIVVPTKEALPVIYDPNNGAGIPFKDFGNPEICPACQYFFVINGGITDVRLKGLQIVRISTSADVAYQLDARGNQLPQHTQTAQSKKIGTFSGNPVFLSLMKENMAIVGLVISEKTIKGIIASKSYFQFRAAHAYRKQTDKIAPPGKIR